MFVVRYWLVGDGGGDGSSLENVVGGVGRG